MAYAFEVTIGESYQTKTFPAYDIDFFKIVLDKGTLLQVKTEGAPATTRPRVKFYNEKGVEVKTYSASAEGSEVRGPIVLDSGVYFVIIR